MVGKFIVLEGTDGSGKGTQFKLLAESLQKTGHLISSFDFPQYDKPSSYFVQQYLNGKYGSLDEIGPHAASLLFTLDRLDSRAAMNEALSSGRIVLSNRFVASNMAHQGSKISDPNKRKEFFRWVENSEFEIFRLPRPDLNIVLHMPAEVAQKLVMSKESRSYLSGKKADIHESNLDYLKRTEQTYLEIARLFPSQFTLIECMDGSRLLSVEEIRAKVLAAVQKVL